VLGPHDLSIGHEVLGTIPPVRAAAVDGCISGGGASDVISGFVAILADDRVWHSIELSERSPERVRSVRLHCRRGGVTLPDPFADHVAVHRLGVGESGRPCEVERRPISEEWPLKRMLAATLGFLQGGPALKSTAADGVLLVRRVQELIDAARRSRGESG
jgi:predicted dehydrogenase